VIAKWLAQGVLGYVCWDVTSQSFCSHEEQYQNQQHRSTGSQMLAMAISSTLTGGSRISPLSSSALRCIGVILLGWQISRTHNLSVFAGCCRGLWPCLRPFVSGDGNVSWINGLLNGCDPSTCLGGCDKDMSGISVCISGQIFRFAATQFGQKTAGSPLHSLVSCVGRYFARLARPVHVAAWVDDLHF
jgi:hypothetical protein